MSTRKRVDQEREDLRATREKARRAVNHWTAGRFGQKVIIHQDELIPLLGKNLSDVVKRYPRAIEEGKENVWDLKVLAGILRIDDPVTMLTFLASQTPGAWFDRIERVEKEGCSRAQEEAIRNAQHKLTWQVSASANLDEDNGQEIDPWVYAWRRYKENELCRR